MIIDREHIVLCWTPHRARAYQNAEREARREIEAAKTLGHVTCMFPPLRDDGDEWWESVFGVTESELVDLANAAARRYRRTFGPRARRRALEDYIRADARLGAAYGLETSWM